MKKTTIWILSILFSIFILNNNMVHAKNSDTKDVLILHSYHRGFPWCDNMETGIMDVLLKNKEDINVQIEYMDVIGFYGKRDFSNLADLYNNKYGHQKFDLIICTDNYAFDFLIQYKEKIFPNVPLVFSGINDFESYSKDKIKNMTGITEDVDIKTNIELILKLSPKTENIVAIMDDSIIGNKIYSDLKEIMRINNPKVAIIPIKGKTMDETVATINKLPSKTAILYMATVFKEDDQNMIYSEKGVKLLRSKTNIPIYGVWDTLLDNGIIGGKAISAYEQGKSAGKIAERVLKGESTSHIPVEGNRAMKYWFDYNELMHFGIQLNMLPNQSNIINKPASAYSIAKDTFQQIAFAVSLFFVLIIILLIFSIIKLIRVKGALDKSKETLKENYGFLRTLLDTIPNPIFSKDIKGRYKECNTAFEEYLGLEREQIINHTVYEVNQGQFAPIYNKADNELIESRGNQVYESRVIYVDGTEHDVLFSKAVLADSHDKVEGIVGVMLDITERKIIEKKIKKLLYLKEAMLEVNQSIIGLKDVTELFDLILEKAMGTIENARFGSVLILNKERVLSIAASKGYDLDQVKRFRIPLEKSFVWLKTNGNLEKTIIINDVEELENSNIIEVTDNNKTWHIKASISAPIIIDNELYGMINIDSNRKDAFNEEDLDIMESLRIQIEIAISARKLYEETIYLSRYDKLTNIYNRRYFEEIIDEYFKNTEEFKLVIFDLNGLKNINDTYGHLMGDTYIKTFAESLSSNLGVTDILARYGGDEFIALFGEIELDSLTIKMEEISEELKNNPINFEGSKIICSFSYGIASFPLEAENYKKLIKIADDRMYEYKRKFKKEH